MTLLLVDPTTEESRYLRHTQEDDELSQQIFAAEASARSQRLDMLWSKDGVARIVKQEDDDNEVDDKLGISIEMPNSFKPGGVPRCTKYSTLDNDTLSTSSSSGSSSLGASISSGNDSISVNALTFVSSSSSVSPSLSGKHRMRAVVQTVDPDVKSKLHEREGLWCGCWEGLDNIPEESFEMVFVPFETSPIDNTKQPKEELEVIEKTQTSPCRRKFRGTSLSFSRLRQKRRASGHRLIGGTSVGALRKSARTTALDIISHRSTKVLEKAKEKMYPCFPARNQ